MAKQRCLSVTACILAGFMASGTTVLAQTASVDPLDTLRAGKEAFERICSVCHSLYIPLSLNLDEAGWSTIMDRMKATLTESDAQDRARILAYLNTKSKFEKKCSVCHDADRALSTGMSRNTWLATVRLMSARKPGHLTDADQTLIAAYLAVVRPPLR